MKRGDAPALKTHPLPLAWALAAGGTVFAEHPGAPAAPIAPPADPGDAGMQTGHREDLRYDVDRLPDRLAKEQAAAAGAA